MNQGINSPVFCVSFISNHYLYDALCILVTVFFVSDGFTNLESPVLIFLGENGCKQKFYCIVFSRLLVIGYFC